MRKASGTASAPAINGGFGAVARLHGEFSTTHKSRRFTACAQLLTGSAYCFHNPSIDPVFYAINFASRVKLKQGDAPTLGFTYNVRRTRIND